jgi:hypothetical protein
VKLYLLPLLALACSPAPAPVPPGPVPPPPPVDAGADVEDGGIIADDCELARARLQALQCRTDDGDPTWEGPVLDGKRQSFADVCRDAASHGLNYHPECIQTIRDCSERNAAAKGDVCWETVAP